LSNRHSTKMSVRHYKYGGRSFDKGINSSFDIYLYTFGLRRTFAQQAKRRCEGRPRRLRGRRGRDCFGGRQVERRVNEQCRTHSDSDGLNEPGRQCRRLEAPVVRTETRTAAAVVRYNSWVRGTIGRSVGQLVGSTVPGGDCGKRRRVVQVNCLESEAERFTRTVIVKL